jgi:hypothetical protein
VDKKGKFAVYFIIILGSNSRESNNRRTNRETIIIAGAMEVLKEETTKVVKAVEGRILTSSPGSRCLWLSQIS